MRAFGGDRQIHGQSTRALGDLVDGTTNSPSGDRASSRSLSGLTYHNSSGRPPVPSSPPLVSALPTKVLHRTSDTTERIPRFQEREKTLYSFDDASERISRNRTAEDVETTEHKRLEADKAKLAQALLEMEKELTAAKQATRDLAAWSLHERTRLVSEALNQRLLREDYEVMLRQRDEQVVYLLALHGEARLDHARTLIREGEVMERPVSAEDLRSINMMRSRVGLPPINKYGAVTTVLEENTEHGHDQFVPWVNRDRAHELEIPFLDNTEQIAVPYIITKNKSALQALEVGDMTEDDECAYSPPEAEAPTSINDQVDALIAEEKDRYAGW